MDSRELLESSRLLSLGHYDAPMSEMQSPRGRGPQSGRSGRIGGRAGAIVTIPLIRERSLCRNEKKIP